MPFGHYREALLGAIQTYEKEKGKKLSKGRQKDIQMLQDIIQNPDYVDPYKLRKMLLNYLSKMNTGWWIFYTGNSQLKKHVLHIVYDPRYAPDKLIAEDLQQRQKALIHRMAEEKLRQQQAMNTLRDELKKLNGQVEQKRAHLYELDIQLQIKQQQLGGQRYHLTYEDYLIHLLDKFIAKVPLHTAEAQQLLVLLDEKKCAALHLKQLAIINEKLADACEYAFYTLVEGVDHLVDDNIIQPHVLDCITQFANSYCQNLQKVINDTPYFERLTAKLLYSYYQDGAGKTQVACLSNYLKSTILASKEMLIVNYGTEQQRSSIAPLCELRAKARWDEFKKMCLEKGRYLFQWLNRKNTNKCPLPEDNTSINEYNMDKKCENRTLYQSQNLKK